MTKRTYFLKTQRISFSIWAIVDLKTNQFIGCCGLRPHLHHYEIGFNFGTKSTL